MADQSPHDVVINDKSMGEPSPVDAHASHNQHAPAPQGSPDRVEKSSETPSAARDPKTSPEPHTNGSAHTHAQHPPDDQHGYDTDTSRAEGSATEKDGGKPLRSSSVKKPASFKPVSITKSFLAKTATSTPAPPPKLGEKAAPPASSLQPLAKPRLVAKSGSSGLRDLPRTQSGDGTSAPNGRTVWNRNQPVPAPPPKQFTDEELKQQYGIHLTSRLQSDDPSTEKSRWADIDEDEDDWAPETVEWMDGTKTTINVADAHQPQPVQQAQQAQQAQQVQQVQQVQQGAQQGAQQRAQQRAQPQQAPAEPKAEEKMQEKALEDQPPPQVPAARPSMTALKRPTSATATRTILRPGASQQSRHVGPDGNLTPDKQSLASKGPPPAPTKSPWAALPPVEKVSPIVVSPPAATQPPSRFAHRDTHGFETISQPLAAREIAADTFDRSWREGERTNRELFNSQSGRYEPAPDRNDRRGSRQQDHLHRQPAVLQRPSPQSGHAEPSAAFQSRSGGGGQADGSPWAGRRRGSSFTGSMPRDRRVSISAKSFEANETPVEAVAEVKSDVQSPAPSAPLQQQQLPQTDGAIPTALSVADERERQKKLMQEKREAAIRRKQEEEAREEAERRERIRKKMEALGMSALGSKSEKPSSSPVQQKAQPEARPSDGEKTPDPSPDNLRLATAQPVAAAASPSESHEADSQTRPAQPKQFSPKRERAAEPSLPFAQNTRATPKSLKSPQLPGLQQHSPNESSRTSYQHPPLQGVAPSSFTSPGDQKVQPARLPSISSGDSFAAATPWGNSGMTAHSAPGANVWGPPTNNRHIGNGTFDAGYSSISPGARQQHQNAPFPAPFGRSYPQRIPSKTFGQSGPPPPAPGDQPYGPLNTLETRMSEPAGASPLAGTSPLPEPARAVYPAPIAPPQKAAPRAQQTGQRDTSAWTNFAMNAQTQAANRALDAGKPDPTSPRQRWTETFKQTRGAGDSSWLGGARVLAATEQTVRVTGGGDAVHSHKPGAVGEALPPSQSPMANHLMSPQPPTGEQIHMSGEGIVRLPPGPSSFTKRFGSPTPATPSHVRLPPLAAHSGNVQPVPASAQPATPTAAFQQSRFFPSALYGGSPPPEEADHPVCGGGARHPHVNLPMPKPKVKLPPASAATRPQASPVTMPRNIQSHRVGMQPLVQTSDWQARFNGLFGKAQVTATTPPSPPKTPPREQDAASAVATISKTSMDFVAAPEATTVSLPRSVAPKNGPAKVVSKPGVDDIFDGELSFGSTPTISLPRGAHYAQAQDDSNSPSKLPVRAPRRPDVVSKPPMWFPNNETRDVWFSLSLPASGNKKDFILPRKANETTNSEARKSSTRFNKNKRGGPNPASSDSPNAASSASKGATRTSSYQKGQNGASNDSATMPSPVNGAAQQADADASTKRGGWAKVPRARNTTPRSRG